MGVGMPETLHLETFGRVVADFFDETPYLVGSAMRGREWRDVDVRVLVEDAKFIALFGALPRHPRGTGDRSNPRWASLCAAYAELGRRMTGLPIDFQVQLQRAANERYDGLRGPLGILIDPETRTPRP